MMIDELTELAQDAREDLGGGAQVRIACQPGYPVRAALRCVTVPPSTDPPGLYGPDETAVGQQDDGTFVWLATGDLPDGENPYAPEWAWPGSYSVRRGTAMSSSAGKHLASYPCTAASSRALVGHLRGDHGKAVYTSPYEDHATHSAMHAAAHEPEQRGPLTASGACGRPHPPHGPVPASVEPAGGGQPRDGRPRARLGVRQPQHGRTPPAAAAAAAAAARLRWDRRSA